MNNSKRHNRAAWGTPARNRLYAGVFAALLAIGAIAPVYAQSSDTPQEYSIQAGSLGDALNQLAAQSKLQIVYSPDLVKGKTVSGLSGRHTLRTALQQLLQGAGLEWGMVNDSTVVIRKASATPAEQANPGSRPEPTSQEEEVTSMPAIMVTGKRTLNVDIERTRDDIQPYVVYNRAAIEQSGAVNLEDFFKKKLTMSATAVSQSQVPSAVLGNTSTINLRGLGSDETLILVDGRRIAGVSLGGDTRQPDINGIPLSAIERIEVLPTTASGIYGGGATGGAINIVLRRDYSGIEASVTYGNTFDTDVASRRADINAGWSFNEGRTSLLLAGSWSDSNRLLVRDRDLVQRGRAHIEEHNPGFFYNPQTPPLGATTNIRSSTGGDLTLRDGTSLGAPITWIPYGYAGTFTDGGQALINNSGLFNLDIPWTAQQYGERQSLLNSPSAKSMMMTLRNDFTSDLQAFLAVNASSNTGYSQRGLVSVSTLIPASAPNNPFEQDIFVTAPAVGVDSSTKSKSEVQGATAGIVLKLPRRWLLSTELSWNRSNFEFNSPGRATSNLVPAVSSGQLDVLRDLNRYPLDLDSYVGPALDALSSNAILKAASLRLAGPLPWVLPGGSPTLTTLIEHRDESIGSSTRAQQEMPAIVYSDQSQIVNSLYVEALLPLVSHKNRKVGIESLDLQFALRYDDYRTKAVSPINLLNPAQADAVRITTTESSIDPTIGLRYRPTPGTAIRASYGTGYLPPSMSQLVPASPPFDYPMQALGLTDPLRGGEPLGLTTLFWDSVDLQPEQSTSWSAGVVLTPDSIQNLRISADWVRIRKEGNITRVWNYTQRAIDQELFVPGLVIRAPALPDDPYGVGPITGVSAGLFNIASLDTEAIDFAVDYSFDTATAGTFDLALAATRLLKLQTQLTPSSPVVENAGAATAFTGDGGGLKWKANASVRWQRGNWTLGWATDYFDGYWLNPEHEVVPNQGSASIPSQTYHNLFGVYELGETGRPFWKWASGTKVHFGINNIFNRKPPVDVASGFGLLYYSPWGDPRLANYYISIRKNFGD